MQLPVRKFFQVMIGTTLLGGGISLNFLGNLGLGPWGAFHDGLSKITGIINGTSNYILSSMHNSDKTFNESLEEAQDLGFAESDPTNDVGGFDAKFKINILLSLIHI